MQRNRFVRTVGVMVLLLILAASMYAFTAANTVPSSNAGIGNGTVGGYTVSDIAYTFAEDASTVASVEFSLNGEAGTVNVRTTADGDWVSCSEVGGDFTNWTCPIAADTAALEYLEVAAAD